MKINIYENPEISETEIIINCTTTDESITKIISMLRYLTKKITGMKSPRHLFWKRKKILYIESVDKKTFLYTKNDIYESSLRLYELEDKLAGNDFFRVSSL